MSYEKKQELSQKIVSWKVKKGYYFLKKQYEQKNERKWKTSALSWSEIRC